MKNFSTYLLLSSILLLVSCKEEPKTPKVIYDATNKERSQQKIDTSKILVSDLPIQMEGTSVLLFPIGEFSVDRNSILIFSISVTNPSICYCILIVE